MLIGEEKYACEACIRGHRGSSCRHSDRLLKLINKKGRPASQCSHCRTLRSSRSAHVKCNCGEKHIGKERDSDVKICSCIHGGRCSCSLKKEYLDPAHRSDSDENPTLASSNEAHQLSIPAPQIENAASILESGHHAPAPQYSNTQYTCGLPCAVPKVPSVYNTSPLAPGSVDSRPHITTVNTIQEAPYFTDSMVAALKEQRRADLDLDSPHLASSSHFTHLNSQFSHLEVSSFDKLYDDFHNPANSEPSQYITGNQLASFSNPFEFGVD